MSQVEQENGDPETEENPDPEEDSDWAAGTVNEGGPTQGYSSQADEPEANSGFSAVPDASAKEKTGDTLDDVKCEDHSGDQAETCGTQPQNLESESDQQLLSLQTNGESKMAESELKDQPEHSIEAEVNQQITEGSSANDSDSNQLFEGHQKDSLTSSSAFSGDIQVEPVPDSDAPEDEISSNLALVQNSVDANQLTAEAASKQQEVNCNNLNILSNDSLQELLLNADNPAVVAVRPVIERVKDSQTPECDRDSGAVFRSFCDIPLDESCISSVGDKEQEDMPANSDELEIDNSVGSCNQSTTDGAHTPTNENPVTGNSSTISEGDTQLLSRKEADSESVAATSQTKSQSEQCHVMKSKSEPSLPLNASKEQSQSSDSQASTRSSSPSVSHSETQTSNNSLSSGHHKNQSPSVKPNKTVGNVSPSLSTSCAVLPTSHVPDHSPKTKMAEAAVKPLSSDIKKQLELALNDDDDDDGDIDLIMSELDAELLPRSSDMSQHQHLVKKQPNSKALGKGDHATPANGILTPDIRELQEHSRQLLQQLKIRDEEIRSLAKERESLRGELSLTQSERDDLLKKLATSSNHNADDIYLPQIKELEKTIAQQQEEIRFTKGKLASHDNAAKRAVTTLQNELKCRVDQVTKQYEEAVKEKDAIVVKFASSESKTMENRKVLEKLDARLKEALKERDQVGNALKAANADRQKALSNYDMKCNEVANTHKELEKMKEALSSSDYRIKWFQNKLKDELEAHKETKSTLEKTVFKLKEAKEETEVIRTECQAIVKTYQESEEIKSNSLDKELKIKESQLKLRMQEFSDTEEIQKKTMKELESLKAQYKDTMEELKALKQKATGLEETLSEKELIVGHLQDTLKNQKASNSELQGKINSTQNLEDDFSRAQEMIKSLDKDVAELKLTNRDLQKDMESCRERESKMLALQSELSRTNALLRSENTTLSNKASNLTAEVEKLKMEVQELETTVKHLSDSYEEEKKKRNEEIDTLRTSLDEKTKENADYKQKWEDELDSNKTLKRRHANNVKDLTRQLQQAKRKLENLEGSKEGGSMGSRTNSNGSLNSVDNSGSHNPPAQANFQQEYPVITEQVEVDKHVLIERIVRLQKSHARKNEKLEFLSEHIHQLLEEIKKKNKIIQSYVLREEAGTLSSEDMDANKEEARKDMQTLLARKGGIMASLYSVHQQDGHMTLELSLQINKKLQAVLEDTLLKNITLKENLDTLGEEIARLSQQNRKLQLHLHDLEAASAERKAKS